MKTKTIRAYHFTGEKLRDGSPLPAKGVWLKHKGAIELCKSGLHASTHPFDALKYAPGNMLHLVEVRGDIQYHDPDKVVARERRIIKSIDAEKLLRDFARWNARQVIHLWKNAPKVVLDYLKTEDESLMVTAWAEAIARAEEGYAAWAAALAASNTDAIAEARGAAKFAAWAAGGDAVWAAAWDSAHDAYIKKARIKFNQMVKKAFKLL
jgi:hypothetical protein